MRYIHILIVVGVILNLYQCRYSILQLSDTSLNIFIGLLTDLHHYIQQLINSSSKVIVTCNTANNIYHNYNLSEYENKCPEHRYDVQIISRRPLIIYIENFLTSNEIQYLIQLANPFFENSTVANYDGSRTLDESFRLSSTTYLQRAGTPIIKCIEKRFAKFQGNINPLQIEPLQVVKYQSNQFFHPHFDWFYNGSHLDNGGQRITTFFTYLFANCTNGETEFIEIKYNQTLHERFCKILICDDVAEQYGLRFRPIPGNSIFWFNVDENNNNDELTLHAGRPPSENGFKIGLNTWTRHSIFHN
ncbi:unnamed protein product [Adineta ricciae]|uniref:Prolyl 4-hydroxylase alpha subunit domain-containing protein n=1 Tax=Adineta ricciae TaxID=249248 RepID=A0A815V6X0_ADIRI|nr:unnamed protein product [Adineta ricciae]CAF1528636.1 unnamed protein product [Adineta ricciae]